MLQSYIVNVSRGETSPSPNYAGGVFVAVGGQAAGVADEQSFLKRESGLGYRPAVRTGHCRIGWVNENNRSFSSLRHCQQNLFRHAHRAIGGLLCHRGLGKKLGPEILDRDPPKVGHDPARPLEGAVLALAGNGTTDTRHPQFGREVTFGVTLGAGQCSLRFLQYLSVSLGLIATRQVESWRGRGRNFRYAPIDPNGGIGGRKHFALAANNEGDVPVAFAITADDTGRGLTRQFTAPDDRNRYASSKAYLTVFYPKIALLVSQRWQRALAALEPGNAQFGLFERLLMRARPPAHGVRLDDPRTGPQPVELRPPSREFLRHAAPGWGLVLDAIVARFVSHITCFHALIPNPSRTVPFHIQPRFSYGTWTQPEVISDNGLVLAHT